MVSFVSDTGHKKTLWWQSFFEKTEGKEVVFGATLHKGHGSVGLCKVYNNNVQKQPKQ